MALDLGFLTRAASEGLTSYSKGKRAQEAANQAAAAQARRALLQESLLQAQIEGLRKPIPLSPGSGLVTRGGKLLYTQPAAPAKPERPVSLAPGGTLLTPQGKKLYQAPYKPSEGKPPTRPQLGDAAYGVRAGIAAKHMQELELRNPDAVKSAAIAINRPNFASVIPFIGQRSSRAVKAMREAGISEEAQQYLNDIVEFAQNAAPTQFTPGSVRSPETVYNMWTEFGPQPGESPAGWEIKRRNRANLVRMAKLKAGDDAWSRALQEFDVTDRDLITTPSVSEVPEAAIGINPRFDPRKKP